MTLTVGQEIPANELQNMTYQPNGSYVGPDSFSWNASDGLAYGTADAAVSLQVIPTDAPPVVADQGVGVGENTAATIALGSQPYGWEASPMTLTLVTAPSDGRSTVSIP